MRIGSLFSGYGGLDLGIMAVLGGSVAWHTEVDPDASRVLAEHWPDVPNLGDITGVDWSEVEPVDVVTGGFPCQDVSNAGRQAGLHPGTRSGLWSQMAYAVSILRPRLVIAENVRGLLSAPAASQVEPCPWCLGNDTDHALRALGAVLGDLADLGYNSAWCGLRASDVGAPHARFRVFVAATNTHREQPTNEHRLTRPWQGLLTGADSPPVADADSVGSVRTRQSRGWGRGSADDRFPVADTESNGRYEGRAESTGQFRRPDVALGGAVVADTDGYRCGIVRASGIRTRRDVDRRSSVDWGEYAAAIQRWEQRLDRPAPEPAIAGRRGSRVLNPKFVEWMQGLPKGHVTAVADLSRNAMLRLLGNGVVPQQAAAALPWLLDTLNRSLGEAP